MYLELIVGAGLLGAIALAWFGLRVASSLRRLVEMPAGGVTQSIAAGVVAAVLVIAVHGLVDSFLSFTATYIAFGIACGLVSACATLAGPHAHRI
jgi:hypothetical protein